jgi:hypothetical protein
MKLPCHIEAIVISSIEQHPELLQVQHLPTCPIFLELQYIDRAGLVVNQVKGFPKEEARTCKLFRAVNRSIVEILVLTVAVRTEEAVGALPVEGIR